MRGLEHLSYKKRLGEMGLLGLEKSHQCAQISDRRELRRGSPILLTLLTGQEKMGINWNMFYELLRFCTPCWAEPCTHFPHAGLAATGRLFSPLVTSRHITQWPTATLVSTQRISFSSLCVEISLFFFFFTIIGDHYLYTPWDNYSFGHLLWSFFCCQRVWVSFSVEDQSN